MTEQQAPERDPITRAGFAIVGLAAAVLSFAALSDLAFRSGVTGTAGWGGHDVRLSWLWPVVIDVTVVFSTRIWHRKRVAAEAVTFAGWVALTAIGWTVVGNAYHGLLNPSDVPPWLARVLVSATPALAVAALGYLHVLVGRPLAPEPSQVRPTAWDRLLDDACADEWVHAHRTWQKQARDQRADEVPPAGEADLPAPPSRDEPDAVLVADLRVVDETRRVAGLAPLPIGDRKTGIRGRYSVGYSRAKNLRGMADTPASTRPHLVPAQDDEEVPA